MKPKMDNYGYYSEYPDEEILETLYYVFGNTSMFEDLTGNRNLTNLSKHLKREEILEWIEQNEPAELEKLDTPNMLIQGIQDELGHPDTPNMLIQGIQIIGVPIILFPGIIGNALSLIVFLWTHLKVQSSSIYLAFLNIVDIAFLLTLLPLWTSWLGYGDWLVTKTGWCHITIYLNTCFAFLSVWAVVSISAERYVVVFYPWLRHRLCSRRRTIYVVLALCTMGCIITSYPLWAVDNVTFDGVDVCFPSKKVHRTVIQTFVSIDTIFRFAIPGILIVFLNGRIGYHIVTLKGEDRALRGTSSSGDALVHEASKTGFELVHGDRLSRDFNCQSCNYVPSQTGDFSVEYVSVYSVKRNQRITAMAEQYRRSRDRRRRYQINATRSLLAITSMFFFFNLPRFIVRIHSDIITIRYNNRNNKDVGQSHAKSIWEELALFLYYLNFSANFIMYVAVSRHFRQGLKRLFKRLKRKINDVALKNINHDPLDKRKHIQTKTV